MSVNVHKCLVEIINWMCYGYTGKNVKNVLGAITDVAAPFIFSGKSSMNRLTLQSFVKGKYGRRVSYENTDTVTSDNILHILANHIGEFNLNKRIVKYLWDYKNGDQPILYRTKVVRDDIINNVVENHAYEITQFCVAQTYGEPIQYVSRSKDENVNVAVDELNDWLHEAHKFQRNITQGEWKSATGTSFLAVQYTGNDDVFRIIVPTPMDTFVIYSRRTGEPLLAVQELRDESNQTYYLCFSDNMEFAVKNGQLIGCRLHAFGGIPIVEIPNNQDRISDIELVITMLDAINTMQSNRVDGIEQFVQSWIKFVNCEVDEEAFQQMKMMGALVVKSNNGENKADVDVMTQELNQSETQIAKDDTWSNVQSILGIPNRSDASSGGDRQGATELKNGWDFSKQRARLKDAYVMEAEKRLAKVIINMLRVSGHKLGLVSRDFEVNIPHSPQDNLVVKCQALQYMLQCGVHPLIALKTAGLWSDSEKVYLMSKPYLDVLYKTIEDAEEQLALTDGEQA